VSEGGREGGGGGRRGRERNEGDRETRRQRGRVSSKGGIEYAVYCTRQTETEEPASARYPGHIHRSGTVTVCVFITAGPPSHTSHHLGTSMHCIETTDVDVFLINKSCISIHVGIN
jgi:hypothetical protein